MNQLFLISGANAVYLPLVLIAIGAGLLVFADEKGTADHKFWGRFYFLFAFAVSAVHLANPGEFKNAFDIWLPAMTLAALMIAFLAIRTAKGNPAKIRLHANAMAFSYVLFLGSAAANLMGTLAFAPGTTFWTVLVFLAISLIAIVTKLPAVVNRYLKTLT